MAASYVPQEGEPVEYSRDDGTTEIVITGCPPPLGPDEGIEPPLPKPRVFRQFERSAKNGSPYILDISRIRVSSTVHDLLNIAKRGEFDKYFQALMKELGRLGRMDWATFFINARPYPRRYAALHFAAERGSDSAVQSLLAWKADPLRLTRAIAKGEYAKAASDLARRRNLELEASLAESASAALLELARSWREDELLEALRGQSSRNNTPIPGRPFGPVTELIKKPPRSTGWSLLHHATSKNSEAVVRQLIFMKVNVDERDEEMQKAREIARNGRGTTVGEAVHLLLEVSSADGAADEETAQDQAARVVEALSLVKKRDADGIDSWFQWLESQPEGERAQILNILPQDKRFALIHQACWLKQSSLVDRLLSFSADPCLKTADGMSTVECASIRVEFGNGDILQDTQGLTSKMQILIDHQRKAPPAIQVHEVFGATRFDPKLSRAKLLSGRTLPDAVSFASASNYTFNDEVDEGSFGTVYAAQVKGTDISRAVKIVSRSRLSEECGEVWMLRNLDHRNIIKLHEIFQTTDRYYVVTQLAEGGNLREALMYLSEKNYLDRRQPRWVQQVFHGCLLALSYCHNLEPSVVHMDIKPENIFLLNRSTQMWRNPHPVLCDFGVSQAAVSKAQDEVAFNPGFSDYMAPELWAGEKSTSKSDIFSLGCVLFYCQSGQHAFAHPEITTGRPKADMLKMHRQGPGSRFVDGQKQAEAQWRLLFQAKDLGSFMLRPNPDERCSVEECLKHRWMQDLPGGNLKHHQIAKLRDFAAYGPITKLALMTIAVLVPANRVDVYPLFKAADKSGRGLIGKTAFLELMEKKGISHEVAELIFNGVDLAREQELCHTDVVAAFISSDQEVVSTFLPEAFRVLCGHVSKTSDDPKLPFSQLQDLLKQGLFKTESSVEGDEGHGGPLMDSPRCVQLFREHCRKQGNNSDSSSQDNFATFVQLELSSVL